MSMLFRVKLKEIDVSYLLVGGDGHQVYDVEDAIDSANRDYASRWDYVYNDRQKAIIQSDDTIRYHDIC